jgi:hypothetical protein
VCQRARRYDHDSSSRTEAKYVCDHCNGGKSNPFEANDPYATICQPWIASASARV